MNDWVSHVKAYQAQHGCSYKDAMCGARSTYQKGSVEGGKMKFNLGKAVKKVTQGAKRGSKLVQQHQDLAKMIAPQYANEIDKVSKASAKVSQFANLVDGSGFNMKKAVHKATRGVKKASKTLEQNKELVKMIAPQYANEIDKVSRQSQKALQLINAVDGSGMKHFGRKLKHTVSKVSKNLDKYAPMLEMVAPELIPVLEANKTLRGGALGSTRNGRQNPYLAGGSFSVPGHHGGSFAVPGHHGGTIANNSSLISPYHPAFHPKKLKSYRELIVTN